MRVLLCNAPNVGPELVKTPTGFAKDYGPLSHRMIWDENGKYLGQFQANMLAIGPDESDELFFSRREGDEFDLSIEEMQLASPINYDVTEQAILAAVAAAPSDKYSLYRWGVDVESWDGRLISMACYEPFEYLKAVNYQQGAEYERNWVAILYPILRKE